MTEADIDFTWNGATIPIVNADSETETGAKMYPILLIMRTGSWKPKHLYLYFHEWLSQFSKYQYELCIYL